MFLILILSLYGHLWNLSLSRCADRPTTMSKEWNKNLLANISVIQFFRKVCLSLVKHFLAKASSLERINEFSIRIMYVVDCVLLSRSNMYGMCSHLLTSAVLKATSVIRDNRLPLIGLLSGEHVVWCCSIVFLSVLSYCFSIRPSF